MSAQPDRLAARACHDDHVVFTLHLIERASGGAAGTFTAGGAVEDAGVAELPDSAVAVSLGHEVRLTGRLGAMRLVSNGAFHSIAASVLEGSGHWRVEAGDGAYSALHGGGGWTALVVRARGTTVDVVLTGRAALH